MNIIRAAFGLIDDFLFVAPNKETCRKYLHIFLALCTELDIPVAPHKTLGPDTKMIFLGILLNSREMTASLPIEKITTYGKNIVDTIAKEKVTLRKLQSLIGQLQFSTSVIMLETVFKKIT